MGVSQTCAQKEECKEIRKHSSQKKRVAKKSCKVFHFGTEHGKEQLKNHSVFWNMSAKQSLKSKLRGSIHNVYSEFDLGPKFVIFSCPGQLNR